jgi:hypothetical protein
LSPCLCVLKIITYGRNQTHQTESITSLIRLYSLKRHQWKNTLFTEVLGKRSGDS